MPKLKETANKPFNRFLLLWSGELISAVGSGLTDFGIGVYIFMKTGSVTYMALVTLIAFLPTVLLSVPAGLLADRYDRRLLMLLGDSLSATGLIYILICMFCGGAQVWQICVGVGISSVFSSLMDPAYRATVTDMLPEDEFTKASGLVQMTGSAKYLISPLIAGFLLAVGDIKLILIIDICTFFVTVFTTATVRNVLPKHENKESRPIFCELKEGFSALTAKKGVMTLVVMSSVICLCLGFIQTLASPMVLSFTDSATLGTVQTVCACGMLVSSVLIGVFKIKKGYAKILSLALFGAGVFMALFGAKENIFFIGASGFLFFSMLPFANTSIDYLVRTNIENSYQGRAWGFISLISQFGYIFAYAFSGILSDKIFTPLLCEGGALSGSVGRIIGVGNGRGIAFLIIIGGAALAVTSIVLFFIKPIRRLEATKTHA